MGQYMLVSRDKVFKPDGTLRGLCFAKASTRRGAVLSIGLDRRAAKKLLTSLIVDGKDFGQVYRQAVYLIADHYEIPHHHELVLEMLNTKDAFLRLNGLMVKPVCYEQVVSADE